VKTFASRARTENTQLFIQKRKPLLTEFAQMPSHSTFLQERGGSAMIKTDGNSKSKSYFVIDANDLLLRFQSI
jgi:hypothetical protein